MPVSANLNNCYCLRICSRSIFVENKTTMKAKTLFITDLLLLLAFIPVSTTGFALHYTGHQCNHELWHNWAVAHVLSSLIFFIPLTTHIYGHWGWYKSLLKNGTKNKSRVTIILSALMLIVIITGIIVLFKHQGANSNLGIRHYILGIILSIVAIGHFIKRRKVLFKGLKK